MKNEERITMRLARTGIGVDNPPQKRKITKFSKQSGKHLRNAEEEPTQDLGKMEGGGGSPKFADELAEGKN